MKFVFSTGICDRLTCGLKGYELDEYGYFKPYCGISDKKDIGEAMEEAKANLLIQLNKEED